MATKTKPSKTNKPAGERRQTLADLWDDTTPDEASNLIDVGEHEVRVNKMEIKEDAKKGTAVFVEYESIDGEQEGKKVRQMYKLTDAAGAKAQGMGFLMRDLALMGHEEVKGSKLKKKLAEISEEQPMVTIVVKDNGQYRNAYLQGSVEDAKGAGKDGDSGDDDIEVGSKVKWDDDGDEKTGEVIKINEKKGTAKVKDDDDDEHTVDLDDLELADGDADGGDAGAGAEIEVGSKVKGENAKGDDIEGEVIKIKDDVVKVKDDDGDIHKCNLDDLELVEEDAGAGASAEIEVGSKVKGENQDGDDIEGEVIKIKDDVATVKDDDGDKHKCDLDELELVDEDGGNADEIEVGDTVKGDNEAGDEVEGEVIKIKGDVLIVKDDDGDKHKIEKDDAEKVD